MTTAPTNTVILAIILIAIVVAVVAWLIVQRQRSLRLKRRFGPEYDLTVSEFRSQAKAEAELMAREKRVAGLKIVPLNAGGCVQILAGVEHASGPLHR